MRTNLKMILAAMGAAALVASPVMAKTMPHRHVAPSAASTSGYARASAVPYSPYGVANEGGPYTPSKPAPSFGKNNDFQDGPR